jgi:hypothetical protein
MKGGTAFNLFLHDMPRLSVDIDVVFTDHTLSREDALLTIAADLKTAKSEIAKSGLRASLPTTKSGDEVKLIVEGDGLQVKLEVNRLPGDCTTRNAAPTNAKIVIVEWSTELREVIERARELGPDIRPTLLCNLQGEPFTGSGFRSNWHPLIQTALKRPTAKERNSHPRSCTQGAVHVQ